MSDDVVDIRKRIEEMQMRYPSIVSGREQEQPRVPLVSWLILFQARWIRQMLQVGKKQHRQTRWSIPIGASTML